MMQNNKQACLGSAVRRLNMPTKALSFRAGETLKRSLATLMPVMTAAADIKPFNTGRDRKLRRKPSLSTPTSVLMTPTRNVIAAMYSMRWRCKHRDNQAKEYVQRSAKCDTAQRTRARGSL